MDKKVIFYLIYDDNLINNKIYNTYANYIHFGNFSISNINNLPKIFLNKRDPFDNYYNDMWFDLGISTEKNIKCLMVLKGINTFNNLFNNYEETYKILKDFINNALHNNIIKGIDLDIENCATIENTKKLICDIKKDFPDFIISLSTIGYSMCVKDMDSKYENNNEWSYSLFNTTDESKLIDYYNCLFNEDDFTLDSFKDMIDNGFLPNKINIGCDSKYFQDYDNYYELRCINKTFPLLGGVFIKYFNDIPYKWDLSAWLCITSK